MTFTITIARRPGTTGPTPEDREPSFGSQTIADKSWTQRQQITGFTLPTATGGDGPLTYSLSPALPNGLSQNASHRVTGTPSGHQAAATYTWKATDVDGDSAELTFTITIAKDLSPAFATTIANQSWAQGRAITAFTLPTATGGDGTLTYTLSPALPAGISRNASHQVTGTPTGHQAAATYTWQATDADGDTAELTFTIAIAEYRHPLFSTTIGDQRWTEDQEITAFTLPTATGGTGALTYTLRPALPAGVVRNAAHRVSGEPETPQEPILYEWSVADERGETATLSFYITVVKGNPQDDEPEPPLPPAPKPTPTPAPPAPTPTPAPPATPEPPLPPAPTTSNPAPTPTPAPTMPESLLVVEAPLADDEPPPVEPPMILPTPAATPAPEQAAPTPTPALPTPTPTPGAGRPDRHAGVADPDADVGADHGAAYADPHGGADRADADAGADPAAADAALRNGRRRQPGLVAAVGLAANPCGGNLGGPEPPAPRLWPPAGGVRTPRPAIGESGVRKGAVLYGMVNRGW